MADSRDFAERQAVPAKEVYEKIVDPADVPVYTTPSKERTSARQSTPGVYEKLSTPQKSTSVEPADDVEDRELYAPNKTMDDSKLDGDHPNDENEEGNRRDSFATDYTHTLEPTTVKHSWSVRGCLKASWKFFMDYYLPLSLLIGVIIGIVWPLPGKVLGDARLGSGACIVIRDNHTEEGPDVCVWGSLPSLAVTTIFIVSGLQLNTSQLFDAIFLRKQIALGLFLIFIITSVFGLAFVAIPSKLHPPEFTFGIGLFSIMPTTLSGCVIIVGYANGNVPLSLLLSVGTNLIGVAILPLSITWLVEIFVGGDVEVEAKVDALNLCANLLFTVLIPLIAGMAVRPFMTATIERHNLLLKIVSASALSSISWMKVSQDSHRFKQIALVDYVILLFVMVAIHFWFLMLCHVVVRYVIPVCEEPEARCLIICGAQKTLAVSLSVLDFLPSEVIGDLGLVAVPIIIGHLFQTIFDASLAVEWAKTPIPVKDQDQGIEEEIDGAIVTV